MDAPKLDPRTLADVIAQTEKLAQTYSGWQPSGGLDFGGVLVRLFGGMVDHLIKQLNQVPAKHQLAFTSLLGAERIPPRAARVPLTFQLSPGTEIAEIPAAAQIAGTTLSGQSLTFETEVALGLTRAELTAVFVRDPGSKRYADRTALASTGGGFDALGVVEPLQPDPTNHAVEHELYVDVTALLAMPGIANLELFVRGATGLPPITWATGVLEPPVGSMQRLLIANPNIPLSDVNDTTARWLRGTVTAPESVRFMSARVDISMTTPTRIGAAFFNTQRLDLGRDILPFGDTPRFNDVFYVACGNALAQSNTSVTITLALAVPESGVKAKDAVVQWETWDGKNAVIIGTSTMAGPPTGGVTNDSSFAFTKSGAVTVTIQSVVDECTIGGVQSRWLRARLIGGNYGTNLEVTTTTTDNGNTHTSTVKVAPATSAPPSITAPMLTWSSTKQQVDVGTILRRTAYRFDAIPEAKTDVTPIYVEVPEAVPETTPTLHLGFDRAFEAGIATLFVQVLPPTASKPADYEQDVAPPRPLRLRWEFWDGAEWAELVVDDGTQDLSRSGLLRFLLPGNAARLREFGKELFWIRARPSSNDAFAPMPRVGRILTNTVWAAHAHAVTLEVLGSSNGARDQRFKLSQFPVLAGQQIEVGEPDVPPAAELADTSMVPDTGPGGAPIYWTRWRAVPDFWASGPRDRHYLLDAATGEITFGDGSAGLVPPAGLQNVRAASYVAGGGTAGNVGVGVLTQLKTSVPHVDSVVNILPAVGGAAAEADADLTERAARTVRHGGRAVTAQDYVDLALEASTSIARAVAITPAFSPISQAEGPLTGPTDLFRDGEVIVVIVPADARPGTAPTLDLLVEVEDYLRARCPPDARVAVTGPSWVPITIAVEVAATVEDSRRVEPAVRDAISTLFDPIRGGSGGGWDFGRRPHESDVIAVSRAVSGVDHVVSVVISFGAPFDKDNELTVNQFSIYKRLLAYTDPSAITVTIKAIA